VTNLYSLHSVDPDAIDQINLLIEGRLVETKKNYNRGIADTSGRNPDHA
jgi:hypothetical protein